MKQNIAVIDIGSNSVRLVIYKQKHKKLKKTLNQKVTLRLEQDLKNEELSKAGISRLIRTLNRFKKEIRSRKLHSVYLVATESIRKARNQAEIIDRVYKKTGFNLLVLKGTEEAYYTYKAAKACHFNQGILINVGGASTEIIEFKEDDATLISIPIGALNYDLNTLNQTLSQFERRMTETQLIISGGTARNIHRMLKRKHSQPYQINDLTTLNHQLSALTLIQRKSYPGLSEERADIICDGIELILRISEFFSSQELVYSKYGLREGIILSNLSAS